MTADLDLGQNLILVRFISKQQVIPGDIAILPRLIRCISAKSMEPHRQDTRVDGVVLEKVVSSRPLAHSGRSKLPGLLYLHRQGLFDVVDFGGRLDAAASVADDGQVAPGCDAGGLTICGMRPG